jgi:hypothetical protein
MPEIFEKVALFFDKIKSATFWDRFLPWRWRSIRTLSYEAYSEYKQLMESLHQNVGELEQGRTSIATLRQENEQLKINNAKLEKDMTTKQDEITRLQGKIESISHGAAQLKEDIAGLKESEVQMRKQYEDKATTLDRTQKRIEEERAQEKEQQHQAEIKRMESYKKNWQLHQQRVKDIIKQICQKNNVEYVDKVPFKGNPDNTIMICDEYVVFDAKAPAKDDIDGFYNYVYSQAEGLQKYAKQDKVKKEMFLVIPSDTVRVVKEFSFNMADYNVYIITVDALEPIILALKKIEEYEFVDQLTPDERDNICRIIGKFAHTAKRRIQIDNFFSLQFLEILTKCERDIPIDMRERAIELDRAEKLNPPQDRRDKELPVTELVKDVGNLQREAQAKGVVFSKSIEVGIKALPLNQKDEPKEFDQKGN